MNNQDEIIEHWETHLQKHLDIEEPELLLLKGHLILEQLINEILYISFIRNTDLDNLRLSFSKKVDLLYGLNSLVVPRNMRDALKEINQVRNKLAHNLDFDEYHESLKKWACRVLGKTPKTLNRKKTYTNIVREAFHYLAGYLGGLIAANKAFKKEQT